MAQDPESTTTTENNDDSAISETTEIENAKKAKKKKLIIIVVAVVMLLLAIGGGLFAAGILGGGKASKTKAAEDSAAAKKIESEAAFFDAQDMVINITDATGRQRFLKLSLSLELANKTDEPALKAIMPRVTDQFQTYLRELKVEDLRGSAGIYRLRQELLARVRAAAKPVDVRDVLFREILVQ